MKSMYPSSLSGSAASSNSIAQRKVLKDFSQAGRLGGPGACFFDHSPVDAFNIYDVNTDFRSALRPCGPQIEKSCPLWVPHLDSDDHRT